MPFMFDLDLPELTPELGRAIEHETADTGAWPVRFTEGRVERRWYGVSKRFPDTLEILTADGHGHVLVEPDEWDEHAWTLRTDAVPRLAALINIIATHVRAPFDFRATWAGSPIEHTIELTPSELRDVVLAQSLNDHTRYRVIPS